jgi:hypothetical protein
MNSYEENRQYLVCIRIVEGRPPPVVSTRGECSACKSAVWRATTSPAPELATALCVDCALKIMKDLETDVTIMPPTSKQLESIRNVLKQRNN